MNKITELKSAGLWPPKVVPDIYYKGFEHWYTEENTKRIINTFKRIIPTSGQDKCLDVNFANHFLVKIESELFNEYSSLLIVNKNDTDEILKYSIKEGDCYSIPMNDLTLNLVSSYAFLHLIPNHKEYFNEVYRILKPGGCFYSDGDKNLTLSKIVRILKMLKFLLTGNQKEYMVWKKLFLPKINFHQEGISAKNIKKKLLESGFSDVSIIYWVTLNPKYKNKLHYRLLISIMNFLRLNFLFTHVQIIAFK